MVFCYSRGMRNSTVYAYFLFLLLVYFFLFLKSNTASSYLYLLVAYGLLPLNLDAPIIQVMRISQILMLPHD